MSLAPGVRLGPYEIAMPLGAGGMGEVYRARDTKLDNWIGFYQAGKIGKLAFDGGDPIDVCEAPEDTPGAARGRTTRSSLARRGRGAACGVPTRRVGSPSS